MTLALSIVIIAHNEEEAIRECLRSAMFAAEIIVLDSGSSDQTVAICKAAGARVIETDWPGDGPQRNRGIALAQQEWVLCLDADERITSSLASELAIALGQPVNGFYIPFHSHYLGKRIRFGDWRNEQHLRLFRKTHGRYSDSTVYGAQGAHCRPEVSGTVGTLKNPILHYPYPTLEKVLEKVNRYSSGGAALKHQQGKTSSFSKALGHGFWTFIRGYCLKLGFLDGYLGFMLAVSNAEACYYRYLKLYLLNSLKQPPFTNM